MRRAAPPAEEGPIAYLAVLLEREREGILALFARMDTKAMSLSLGVVGALLLVTATAALLVAGPQPGYPVGPNLASLGNLMPGYSVTWTGCILGAAYGALIGAVAGFLFATFWNFAHLVFLGVIALQRNLL